MAIDFRTIMKDAGAFAEITMKEFIKETSGVVTERDLVDISSPDILLSGWGKIYVDSMIIGSIDSYHSQLRTVLLEKGIDIGDMQKE